MLIFFVLVAAVILVCVQIPRRKHGFLTPVIRRKGVAHNYVKFLLLSISLLFGSTLLYMASLAAYIASVNSLVTQARAGLFSESALYTDANLKNFQDDVLKQSWMMTISLCVNVRVYYNLLAKDTDLNPGYRS